MSRLEMRQLFNYYLNQHGNIDTVIKTRSLPAGQRSILLNRLLNTERKCVELHELFSKYVLDLHPVVCQFTNVFFPFTSPDTDFTAADDADDIASDDEFDSDSQLE